MQGCPQGCHCATQHLDPMENLRTPVRPVLILPTFGVSRVACIIRGQAWGDWSWEVSSRCCSLMFIDVYCFSYVFPLWYDVAVIHTKNRGIHALSRHWPNSVVCQFWVHPLTDPCCSPYYGVACKDRCHRRAFSAQISTRHKLVDIWIYENIGINRYSII